jgi:hypothetical protein
VIVAAREILGRGPNLKVEIPQLARRVCRKRDRHTLGRRLNVANNLATVPAHHLPGYTRSGNLFPTVIDQPQFGLNLLARLPDRAVYKRIDGRTIWNERCTLQYDRVG